MMKTYLKLASAAVLAATVAALPAFGQGDDNAAPGPMMQGDSMMGGDASGMMGMMKMMQQMAPMMAACTEMMQVATPQPAIPETTPRGG